MSTPLNIKIYLILAVPFAFVFFLPLLPLVMIEHKSFVGGVKTYYNFWILPLLEVIKN